MLEFTVFKTGESAKVRKGESFKVCLRENPATGFRWKITADGAPAAKLISDNFGPSAGVGGQGLRCWRFQAIQSGESEIAMILQRSWEKPAEQGQSFTLRVIVTP